MLLLLVPLAFVVHDINSGDFRDLGVIEVEVLSVNRICRNDDCFNEVYFLSRKGSKKRVITTQAIEVGQRIKLNVKKRKGFGKRNQRIYTLVN